jgi:RimJ/RimL family protein N-acetyltransferase
MEIDHLNQTAEVGIFIGNKNYWDKGYGTEALILLLDYGFKALNLHNILLKVYAYNTRAIETYEKVGFKQIGIRREALCRNLQLHNIIFMDILSSEYYKEEM